MKKSTYKNALIAGVTLILVTNVIALAGVAYNRSGEAGTIQLTERELRLPLVHQSDDENSGVQLSIVYRSMSADSVGGFISYQQNYEWLDKDKLSSLGFDFTFLNHTKTNSRYDRRLVDKEVILVLEYNGDSYQRTLEQTIARLVELKQGNAVDLNGSSNNQELVNAEATVKREEISASRLFVIDAGLEYDLLREKYANKSKYLLLYGLVGANIAGVETEGPTVYGYINSLSIKHIHVPNQFHSFLRARYSDASWRNPQLPNYEVSLRIGQRLEPWIVNVNPLN